MQPARHRSQVVSALIALLAALFVLLPLGEAVACATDSVDQGASAASLATASIVADGHASGDDDGCGATTHGCVHGHCHASATTPPASPAAAAFPALSARLNAASPRQPGSRAPDQPTRPPRA